ncbi:MAG: putative Glutathione S-transferase [Gammaproteobacteria bacterium]|jgi:glutathione S-transferase|nr:putative Glutathione S-transferase [Gammaproteobacteria bacterium]
MLTLYSYPALFGVSDNNPYGLKVATFMRLAKLDFIAEQVMDTKNAPRGQLPYLVDDKTIVTNSNDIIQYLTEKYAISLDHDLTPSQKNTDFLVRRMLDEHLYWVMSYSRWQDDHNWQAFKAEFFKNFPHLTEEMLAQAKAYNAQRYHFQGIGRFEPHDVYKQGIDDLRVLHELLGAQDYFFGNKPHTIDACIYGFLANIFYFDIGTPLKQYMIESQNLAAFCDRIKSLIA